MHVSLLSTLSSGSPTTAWVRDALATLGHDVDLTEHPDLAPADAAQTGHQLADSWLARRPHVVLALGWVAGLAATLLVGIAIGRSTTRGPDARVSTTAATPAASSAADDPGKLGTGPVIPLPQGPSNSARGGTVAVALPPNGGRGDVPGADTSRPALSAAARARREAAREAALPYRVAALQHLVTTEALLVSLRTDVRAGRKDTTIATWAGELLGTTRMLMDSPAGRDPKLKQLLEDLELVLAQISRLPGAQGEAADLGLIDDAVRHRQIMTRLRALSPDT
jgi:hypothetical protein